jgi:ubiquinone/menaquinone biosynthesis C-methylase UbiE
MDNKCMICQGLFSGKIVKNIDDYTNEQFIINICNKCGIGITEINSDFDVSKYYPSVYYGENRKRFSWFVELLVQKFRLFRVYFIQKQLSTNIENIKILDIGCGRGTELQALNQIGWECYGTEHSIKDLNHLTEKGIAIFNEEQINNCKFIKEKFNVITLWHALEHVVNPNNLLLEIHRILTKEGILIIEVPNFGSFQARLNRSKWIYTETPRHLYHYTIQSLTKLIEDRSFKIKSVSTQSIEFGPIGFITNLFNLIVLEKNLLFKLLFKKKQDRILEDSFFTNIISYLLILIFLLPFSMISIFLEIIAIIFKKGSVIRIVAEKV